MLGKFAKNVAKILCDEKFDPKDLIKPHDTPIDLECNIKLIELMSELCEKHNISEDMNPELQIDIYNLMTEISTKFRTIVEVLEENKEEEE